MSERAAHKGADAMADASTATEVATYCPLCVSRCGARATVTNGTFTLDRDPSHLPFESSRR